MALNVFKSFGARENYIKGYHVNRNEPVPNMNKHHAKLISSCLKKDKIIEKKLTIDLQGIS